MIKLGPVYLGFVTPLFDRMPTCSNWIRFPFKTSPSRDSLNIRINHGKLVFD